MLCLFILNRKEHTKLIVHIIFILYIWLFSEALYHIDVLFFSFFFCSVSFEMTSRAFTALIND